jgi:hypothetical protein
LVREIAPLRHDHEGLPLQLLEFATEPLHSRLAPLTARASRSERKPSHVRSQEMFRSPCPLSLREDSAWVRLTLELLEEPGPRSRGDCTRITGGVKGVGRELCPQGSL